MSALADYLAELRRRRELLTYAYEKDHTSEYRYSIGKAPFDPRGFRLWTRQDKNRWDLMCECEDSQASNTGTVLPFVNAMDQDPRWRRSRTRLRWFLEKYKRHPLLDLHRKALAESQSLGTYPIIAPLLERAHRAWGLAIENWEDNAEGQDARRNWNTVNARLDKVIERLTLNDVPNPNKKISSHQERREWATAEFQAGSTWQRISDLSRQKCIKSLWYKSADTARIDVDRHLNANSSEPRVKRKPGKRRIK